MPEPLLPVAIVAKSKADEDKLSQALSRLVAEDPTLRLENNAETQAAGAVVHGRGARRRAARPARAPVRRRGGNRPTCGCRCGRRSRARPRGSAGNVKQSGGHGEYGICHIEVEPLADAAGFEFVDKIVGGVVPRQFIPSVEKGVRCADGAGRRRPATRWSTSGSRCSTARRTRWTPPTWPSRRRAGLALQGRRGQGAGAAARAGRRGERAGPDDYVGAVMCDLSVAPRPGARHRADRRAAAPWSGPRSRSSRSPGTPSTCGRCRTGTGSFTRSYLRHEPLPVAPGRARSRPSPSPARAVSCQARRAQEPVPLRLAPWQARRRRAARGCRPAAGAAPWCAR